ncbi:MAG: tripartite tricarboxylate transporter TctB family protein [Burkholderiales bacterium]|nr:tripartite tricarboxylate transporter TctB family protein [Burkholderiales bacterium]
MSTGKPGAAQWREAGFTFAFALAGATLMLLAPRLIQGYNPDQPYYARSAFFPWLALSLVVLFGGWSTWQAVRGVRRELSDELDVAHTSVPRALAGAAVVGLYILLCAAVGYPAATCACVFLLARQTRLSRAASLLMALVLTATLYLVFVVGFKVWFAPSWLAGWIR